MFSWRLFSSRLSWDLRPNRLSELLEAKRRSGGGILDLTESNPTRAGFDYPAEEIAQALADPSSLLYEPSPAGLPRAREAVAAYYAKHGKSVEPDHILLTASTSEAYSYLFKLLAGPGDEVLVPRPSYPLFEFLAHLELVRIVHYPLAYHGQWEMDLDALASAVTERTRAVVLVNPNNPTGSFLKRDELERLAEVCARSDLAIISDEVFSDYGFGPDARRVETLVDLERVPAFCLGGLSKAAGLPQMKLGWIALAGPRAWRETARERLEWIADTYLSVGTPVQHALARLLSLGAEVRKQIISRTRSNLEFLRAAVHGTSLRVLDVEGGWYAILEVPRTRSEEEWCEELLHRDSVLVQPGFLYDFESEAFLVVSLLTQVDAFREGMERLVGRVGG
jgi:aspartate/methionine/tyrosine aminotransferase